MSPSYRGRLAPSSTGLLHLGHARAFWTAFERCRAAQGTLVLRIEDLDPQRSHPHFTTALVEDLHWLGIHCQEGPDKPDPLYAPYLQSQRLPFYLAAWEQLRASGHIYPCHCSRRELAQAASAPHEDATPPPADAQVDELEDEPLYPGTCRPAPGAISALTTPAGVAWRFRVPSGETISFLDLHLGPQNFTAGRDFGDFLIWRRDHIPAYQLTVVVDDAAMRITEVVRGADLLKSTARQILLNRALGYTGPAWFHCALVRDAQGRRLSKRHDALSLRQLRQDGRTPTQVLRMAIPPAP